MEIDPQRLPDNPVILRQMVLDLATQLEVYERRLARVQNLLEQLLRWRFGQKREKIDERQLFLFAVQLEASGGDVNELIAELEQEQQEQEQQAQQDDSDEQDPPAAGAAENPKPRGHGRRRLPLKQWVCGSGTGDCTEGAAAAKTEFVYDGTTLTNRTSVTGRPASGFGTGYTARGNLTKVRRWRDLPTGKWIETTAEYDILGNLVKVTDPKGNITTAGYTDNFSNGTIPEITGKSTFAFVTSTTNALSQGVSGQFDYYLGRATKFTDANGVDSTYSFNDALDRLKTVVQANNVTAVKRQTVFTYIDTEPNPAVKTETDQYSFNDKRFVSQVTYDGLGRDIESTGARARGRLVSRTSSSTRHMTIWAG